MLSLLIYNSFIWQLVDDRNNGNNKDNKDNKELPLLKVLKEEIYIPTYNYTTPLILDGNQTDNLAKGHYIKTTL